jgi:hypothetical protein
MKIVKDDDLSVLYSYTQPIAKQLAKNYAEQIIKEIDIRFSKDDKFGDLTYTGAMTFMGTISSHIFMRIFEYSCYIGKQFPDVGHCSREIFEELIQGLRILGNFPEESKTEYPIGGIKRINKEIK